MAANFSEVNGFKEFFEDQVIRGQRQKFFTKENLEALNPFFQLLSRCKTSNEILDLIDLEWNHTGNAFTG